MDFDAITDLRQKKFFPDFKNLPDKHDIDLRYYRSTDDHRYFPRKHWCFLAEIVEVFVFGDRLTLIVKDESGDKRTIAFYDDAHDRKPDKKLLKAGYTVAVLRAEQHDFIDGQVGIRHEDPSDLTASQTLLTMYSDNAGCWTNRCARRTRILMAMPAPIRHPLLRTLSLTQVDPSCQP